MTRSTLLMLLVPLVACAPSRALPDDPGTIGGTPDGGALVGLPCDVARVLQDKCISCHSNPPAYNAPMGLTTYDQLVKPAASNPGKSNAQVSVDRMKASTLPMPPGGGITAAELAALEGWVSAGTPQGSCGAVGGPDGGTPIPLPDLGRTCSSGATWTGRRNSSMRPGEACIACHASDEGPVYDAMGTVYPSVHEPDDCNGLAGTVVEVTGADGVVSRGTTTSGGNFMINAGNLVTPYRATVKRNGKSRAMLTPQTDGDCNACHTPIGLNGAPGRIVAP